MFREAKCEMCGKTFIPTYEWVYRTYDKYYCSYHCYNHRHDVKPEINEPKKVRVSRKVGQYTKSGELIKVFLSAKIASETLGFGMENIRKACRGEVKTYKGFIWKYQK